MKKITWSLQKKKVNELKEYEKNPRTLTEKGLSDLKKSIEKFGIAEPIAINRDGTIIGGHARKKVLEELGIEEVDCYLPNILLSEELAAEICIRLNKNIAGKFDIDMLTTLFETEELIDFGFETFELEVETGGLDQFFKEGEGESKEEKHKIVLEYSEDEYKVVSKKFQGMEGTKEQIVWDLLEL